MKRSGKIHFDCSKKTSCRKVNTSTLDTTVDLEKGGREKDRFELPADNTRLKGGAGGGGQQFGNEMF